VLALATRRMTEGEATAATDGACDLRDLVDDLTIDALVGIVDPPRDEARDAIAQCHRSGVDVKMITGDHAATATAIATELGIRGRTVTGAELHTLSDEELAEQIGDIGVCARVAPEHKVRIVDALRTRGEVVAMTGDGVNDAAALRTADIGVAMGITGTEVTKEAADLVLADDNFATIVGAVERGRVIYDNIVKFVRFQLSTSLSAIGSLIGSSLLGLPVPFTPIQVLFVNLIADGPPAMTLGVDPPSPGTLDRPPRPTDEPILGRRRLAGVVFLGAVIATTAIAMLVWSRERYGEAVALTMTFTTFVLAQLVNALNVRSEHRSLLGRFSLTNAKLWVALGAVTAIQLLVVSWGPLQGVFDTVALTASQWLLCFTAALSVLVAEETRKLAARLLSRRGSRQSVGPDSAPR
jgi:Ca2+-transporting ATPase